MLRNDYWVLRELELLLNLIPPLREVYFSVNFICLQMIIYTPVSPSRKSYDWRSSEHTIKLTKETERKFNKSPRTR